MSQEHPVDRSNRSTSTNPADRGGDQRDLSAHLRDEAAQQRDQAGDQRDQAGDQRDQVADHRDRMGDRRDRAADDRDAASDRRDQAADARDRAAEQEERLAPSLPAATTTHLGLRDARALAAADRQVSAGDRHQNAGDRRRSAGERGDAGQDRLTASTDREAGESERGFAGADRTAALDDRDVSASDREAAHRDDLTGALRRGPGFLELTREVDRAARTGRPLAVAFVDVDELKVVNDSFGHAAGDLLLKQVAAALSSKLRSYDLVIRYGGDEFVCVLPGVTADVAASRLASINAVLRISTHIGSMSVGVSDLQPGDSAQDIVRRADEALYRQRNAAH
jgi:diguanylate cyclase (GGDEF)-like protein